MPSKASGILTQTDVEFLRTEGEYYTGEYAKQSRYDRQRAMRERIVRSILDFSVIRDQLGTEQRRKIFSNPGANGADDSTEFYTALSDIIGWLYLGCREEEQEFVDILEKGICKGEQEFQSQRGSAIFNVEVNVDITPQTEDAYRMSQALEEGEPLPIEDIFEMSHRENLTIDPEEVNTVRVIPGRITVPVERALDAVDLVLKTNLDIDADIEAVGEATVVTPESVAVDEKE